MRDESKDSIIHLKTSFMLDIKYIRENEKEVKNKLATRGVKKEQIEEVLKLDDKRRDTIGKIDEIRGNQNKASREIVKIKDKKQRKLAVLSAKKSAKGLKGSEKILKKTEEYLNKKMVVLPNIPLDKVPIGKSEKDNKVIKEVKGGLKPFDFKPKDYLSLAGKLDLIDIERAGKVSGSRFGYLKREAVLLEFALVQFVLETLTKEGFVPVVPPVMLKEKAMAAMGYLDNGRDEVYYLKKDNLFLVGTAEQSIGAMHADEILPKKNLPLRYLGFSTCFRREAGSYGKDTKGILRVHQFDKLEMFVFSKPEDSKKEHKNIIVLEEELVKALKIDYRLVEICTGYLSAPSARTVDLEMWLPGQNTYRETHSSSNCTDFQSRRLKTRFRDEKGKARFVHTLNGTAFAIGRTLIAIIENYQQEDGSIKIPEVLQKYTLGLKKIKR